VGNGKQPEGEKIRGKVFILTGSGKLVDVDDTLLKEAFTIKKADLGDNDGARSTQIINKEHQEWLGQNGLVVRPYEPESFLTLQESIPVLDRCVRQVATDVAGLGYALTLRKDHKENNEEKDRALTFLEECNDEGDDIHSISERLLIDWGIIGFNGLEIARTNKKIIGKVFHVPAPDLFVHKSRKLFAQKIGKDLTWFKQYGQEGLPKDAPEGIVAENEMLLSKNYYSRSTSYGAPYVLSAAGSCVGLINIRDYNLSFFENFGIPAYLVKLIGDWEEGSQEAIEEFLNTEIKGTENQHKTFVLQIPTGGDAEIERLSVDNKEGSFKVFHEVWTRDVLIAYGMPPYRVGIAAQGSLGGSVAKEMTEIYKQSIIGPLQRKLERMWTRDILMKGLGVKNYTLDFEEIDTKDINAEVDRLLGLHSVGAVNGNEIRHTLDLGDDVPGGKQYVIYATLGQAEDARQERQGVRRSADEEIIDTDSIAKTVSEVVVEAMETADDKMEEAA